jgi:hypothetical protein
MELPDLSFAVRAAPLVIFWPSTDTPLAPLQFDEIEDWRNFVDAMSLNPLVSDVVRLKFGALKLHYLAWIDGVSDLGERTGCAYRARAGPQRPVRRESTEQVQRKLKAKHAPGLADAPPQRSFAAC